MNKKIFYILAFIFSGLQAGDWGQYWQQYFGKSQPKENLLRLYPEYPYKELTPEGKEHEERYKNSISDYYNSIVFPATGPQYDSLFKAAVRSIDLEGTPLNEAFDRKIIGDANYQKFNRDYKELHDKREKALHRISSSGRRVAFEKIVLPYPKIYDASVAQLIDEYKKQGLSDEAARQRAESESVNIAIKMSKKMRPYTEREGLVRFETAAPQYKSSWWNIFGGWWQQYKEQQARKLYESTKAARWEKAQREGAQLAQQQYLPAATRFETAEPQWNKPWLQRRQQQELYNQFYIPTQRQRFTGARQEAISKLGGESYEQICKRYGLKK